jgi:hypothetical protein
MKIIKFNNPNMILRGRGCPKCNFSKGELLISKILKSIGIKFEEQFIIKGLKTNKGGTPRFDFVIFENNILTKIIEYDGMEFYILSLLIDLVD